MKSLFHPKFPGKRGLIEVPYCLMDTLLAVFALLLVAIAAWLLAPVLPWCGLILAGVALVLLVPAGVGVAAGIIQKRF